MSPLQERTLGAVTVLDTPLITKALEYARKHLNDVAYNHSVRCWLYGVVIAAKIPSLKIHDESSTPYQQFFMTLAGPPPATNSYQRINASKSMVQKPQELS
jgi:hypothetical protein